MVCEIINDDCSFYLDNTTHNFDLTYLDPPFNQNKEYNSHNDNMNPTEYWNWMNSVCKKIFNKTNEGGAIYFMQREKNVKEVLGTLEKTGWSFQNLIIWKKNRPLFLLIVNLENIIKLLLLRQKEKDPEYLINLELTLPYW